MMRQLWLKARTAWALGPLSLMRYFRYQIGVRSRLNPIQRIQAEIPEGPFFYVPKHRETHLAPPPFWVERALYFSWFEEPLHNHVPHWHRNPLTGATVADPTRPWWEIPDFDPNLGDIKTIWEASRFDWVVAHACQSRTGDETALNRLNEWLMDWLAHNPPYVGPNWKCGQETSIRVLHLALAALVLGETNAAPAGLIDLVRLHLQRIAPTIQYALAQNNNHGSSEAAALFIGGSWLYQLTGESLAARWAKDGRYWLEDRVQTLIAPDGSFSQYSVNYHRLLLDTLSMVELWRQKGTLPPFSSQWYQRAQAATRWLHAFTDASTGAVPNIGANDGARLLPLDTAAYQDYRPSVQLAAVLLLDKKAYQDNVANERLRWLGRSIPTAAMPTPATQLFDDGGYALLIKGETRLFMRYPRYQFRPSHADALHVDLWLGPENILRDAGSFSYAAEAQWQDYFRGTAGHNTVQLDDRDQMPRFSRFLYGAWLKTTERQLTQAETFDSFTAVYRDWWGGTHRRQVRLETTKLQVTDDVAGFEKKAVLRWRLAPGTWEKMAHGGWGHGHITIHISADVPIIRQEIVEGWESRYYLQRTPLPVLEVEITQAGQLHTTISW